MYRIHKANPQRFVRFDVPCSINHLFCHACAHKTRQPLCAAKARRNPMEEVRCLILTGAGQKSFVAGADIGEMSSLTKAEGEAFGKKGNDVFRKPSSRFTASKVWSSSSNTVEFSAFNAFSRLIVIIP